MKNGRYTLINAPDCYPGHVYIRKNRKARYCYEHHAVYWLNKGVLPNKLQVIHHKDGDTRNNNFDNLELLSRSEHNRNHARERGKTMLLIKCPVCGIEFEREKRHSFLSKRKDRFTTCSPRCSGKLTHMDKNKIDMNKYLIKVFKTFQC